MNDLIEKLSNIRSQFNCFDKNERDAYHTLSEAIKVLSERPEPCEDATRVCTYKPDCPWYDGTKCNSPNDPTYNECDYDRGIFPESYNYDTRADVYYLAEKIGIHRLYALVVELRGEPKLCEDAVSRQILLNDLKELITAWEKYPIMAEQIKGVETAIKYVEMIPSVTPKRKTGRWIDQKGGGCCCSECGRYALDEVDGNFIHVAAKSNFCPNCGADCRGKQDDD